MAETADGGSAGTTPRGGITVTGAGRVLAVPDVFVATFAAEASAQRPSEAMDAAAGALTRMRTAALQQGASADGLRSGSMHLHQQYDQQGRPDGFAARLVLTVRTSHVSGAGDLLGGCIAAGGDAARLENTSFEHADPAALVVQAREAAFGDAVARARQLARHAGRRLGAVVSIEEGGAGVVPVTRTARAQAFKAVPVDPGGLDTTVVLTVSWAWS
jgi:uncharacterized protein YggE